MKLSAKAIKTYNTVNSFSFGNQWSIRAGETNTLYFQIIDKDQDDLRYLLGIGLDNTPASISVTFPSVDDDAVITVDATQVDANDASLWKIELTEDQVPSSGNVNFAITEGAKTKRFTALQFMTVESVGGMNGDCC